MSNNTMIRSLGEWGADLESAMKSMLDNEQFYLDCLYKLYEDEYFKILGEQLENADFAGAFSSAHTLKGITATLGLTPISRPMSDLVELLRREETEGTDELYTEIMQKHKELGGVLKV